MLCQVESRRPGHGCTRQHLWRTRRRRFRMFFERGDCQPASLRLAWPGVRGTVPRCRSASADPRPGEQGGPGRLNRQVNLKARSDRLGTRQVSDGVSRRRAGRWTCRPRPTRTQKPFVLPIALSGFFCYASGTLAREGTRSWPAGLPPPPRGRSNIGFHLLDRARPISVLRAAHRGQPIRRVGRRGSTYRMRQPGATAGCVSKARLGDRTSRGGPFRRSPV